MKMNRPIKRTGSTWNIEEVRAEGGSLCLVFGCGCLFWLCVAFLLLSKV